MIDITKFQTGPFVAAMELPNNSTVFSECSLITAQPLFYFDHEDWKETLA